VDEKEGGPHEAARRAEDRARPTPHPEDRVVKHQAQQNVRYGPNDVHFRKFHGLTLLLLVMISASPSPGSSPLSTPSNAHSSASSTRTRSTYRSTSAPSRLAPSAADCPRRRAPSCWRRPASAISTSPNANLPSRYISSRYLW
jgi:hypothetical protein